jgi:aminopeptidase N
MQLRENFTMDNNNARNSAVIAGTEVYQSKKSIIQITRTTLVLFLSIFVFSLVAVGLLVYHFTVSPQLEQTRFCDTHDYHHASNNYSMTLTDSESGRILDPITLTTEMPKTNASAKVDVRLPRAILPISYDLKLIPFLIADNFTFRGETQIRLRILEDCDNITLHSVQLKIHPLDVKIYKLVEGEDDEEIVKRRQFTVDEKQFYVIELRETLLKDQIYLLRIKYVGQLNDYLQGFYRSSYTVGNETRYFIPPVII